MTNVEGNLHFSLCHHVIVENLTMRITMKSVEPLEYGVVLSGKLWCNSKAIFPKGFRSRVRYINVLDPTNMCYYVSEILDARRDGPLFMVSMENCSSEVFDHVSAARCWELVRDRVNQEITKQHKSGRMNLPPLQPPGSLEGLFYSWESGSLDDKHLYKNLVRPTNEARTLGGVVGNTIAWSKSCIRLL
ncbi:hypothetical protein Q3G72_020661 [Acer saccharum]|nr:hypothetical protein Q3G72_004428 [Acer saccharum]KAK1583056.1 hypothetical protein Q3G72_020661 [Acer saccharum]